MASDVRYGRFLILFGLCWSWALGAVAADALTVIKLVNNTRSAHQTYITGVCYDRGVSTSEPIEHGTWVGLAPGDEIQIPVGNVPHDADVFTADFNCQGGRKFVIESLGTTHPLTGGRVLNIELQAIDFGSLISAEKKLLVQLNKQESRAYKVIFEPMNPHLYLLRIDDLL